MALEVKTLKELIRKGVITPQDVKLLAGYFKESAIVMGSPEEAQKTFDLKIWSEVPMKFFQPTGKGKDICLVFIDRKSLRERVSNIDLGQLFDQNILPTPK